MITRHEKENFAAVKKWQDFYESMSNVLSVSRKLRRQICWKSSSKIGTTCKGPSLTMCGMKRSCATAPTASIAARRTRTGASCPRSTASAPMTLALSRRSFAAFANTAIQTLPSIRDSGSFCPWRSITACPRACSTGRIPRWWRRISPRRIPTPTTATAPSGV